MEDPGIKLFGKKILLPTTNNNINLPVIPAAPGDDPEPADKHSRSVHTRLEDEKLKDEQSPNCSETKAESDNPKTPSIDEETKHESTNPKPKTLKKPDKILPCPRCTSMDTKFCYYNNYNVNQPRHFCKSCQRYWTAGGAMRNMAVGAGRRKSKNPAAHPHYINVSHETVTTNSSSLNRYIPIPIPVPAICPPMPIYPSTYWNCIPFLHPPTPTITDSVLGKRSSLMKSNDCDDDLKKPKSSILIPKTLRIDDPDEAARSSIWTTLGIRNENFNAFQDKSKGTKKHHEATKAPAHQANPAAFSRSVCFQETA